MGQDFGQEFLGAAKFEKFAIQNLPAGRCGKTFSKEFGSSETVLRRWAEKDKHPIIATNGLWRGGVHDYSGDKILAEGLRELEKFARIAEDFPEQKFYFAIYTEHKLKRVALKKVFTAQWEIVKNLHNLCLVNTPMAGGDLLIPGSFGIDEGRLFNEVHGNWNPNTKGMAPYMWACDGLPAQDCNIQKFKDAHNKATVIWLWMQQYNCKLKVDDQTPINERTVTPVKKQVTSLEYLIPSKGDVKFHRGSIYKTHADQHNDTPAPREQKPVIITEVDALKLEFIDFKGDVVHTAPRQGNYTDGRPMYRATLWGFEIQAEASHNSGSAIVRVDAVSKHDRVGIGTVNPAFRENDWRLGYRKLQKSHKGLHGKNYIYDSEAPVSLDWV